MRSIPTLFIAASGSGSGKTMLTSALLAALVQRGLQVQPFKCGPDYLDPLYHTRITGRASRNLDSFLLQQDTLRYLFAEAASGADLAVVEGVMGYYDGLGGNSLRATTWEVSQWLGAKTVLVIDCRGMSLSTAALVRGFTEFVPDSRIAGVILNRASAGLYQLLRPSIEQHSGIPVLGYFPPTAAAEFSSRHLGLVAADEVSDFTERCQQLAELAAETIDLDALLSLAATAPEQVWPVSPLPVTVRSEPCTIAVARDECFYFYYQDNLDLLQRLGAELVEFSPLHSPGLPTGCSGIYLGGGYPELHASTLEQNQSLRREIKTAAAQQMPLLAEGGGFLYLLDSFKGQERSHAMAGVLPGEFCQTQRLGRFGYQVLVPQADNLLAAAGSQIKAHEFHYTATEAIGSACHVYKASRPETTWSAVHASQHLFAGFPYLHFWSQPSLAENFVAACARYRTKRDNAGGESL